jgi:hypothetical protein
LIKKHTQISKPDGLWKAVKIAKDLPTDNLPAILTLNNVEINEIDLPNTFSDFFHNKISTMNRNCPVSPNVYNGKCKLIVDNRFFMSESDLDLALMSLKPKTCEGYDRIPVRILFDALDILKIPLATLKKKFTMKTMCPSSGRLLKLHPYLKRVQKTKLKTTGQSLIYAAPQKFLKN